jgi:phosphoribosylformimino-5-aminoimidazole carboxamide ribotide isomerase
MLGKDCENAAISALLEYPQGLQIGGKQKAWIHHSLYARLIFSFKGGITIENAMFYLDRGASHVIVTSYVFNDGNIVLDRLEALANLVSPNRLVIDLSCRKQQNDSSNHFYVVTNKWTKYTDYVVK